MLKKKIQGFSLLETMVVIVLIGILGMAAMPSLKMVHKQRVYKLAKEMGRDLYIQRMQAAAGALEKGRDSSIEYGLKLLYNTENKAYAYALIPDAPTASGGARTQNQDNPKDMMMIMETIEASPQRIDRVYFDAYGMMYEDEDFTTPISQLKISISYQTLEVELRVDGITGYYDIEKSEE